MCLLASHPLVLKEFQRLLNHPSLRVQSKKLERMLPDAVIPSAGVYVIDFEGNLVATELMVGKVRQRCPDARLLLVGRAEFKDEVAFPLLRLGVKGLLQHSQLGGQLERALQSIALGGYWVPRTLLSRFVDSVLKKSPTMQAIGISSGAGLSRREKEVIQAVLDNLSNKEIASKLNISERTVKFHVSNLLQKFSVRRRADLIVLAFQASSRAPAVGLASIDTVSRMQ